MMAIGRKCGLLSALLCTLFFTTARAQTPKCGVPALGERFTNKEYLLYRDTLRQTTSAFKTTASNEVYTIPVVFHVVLTASQLNQLGGETGLQRYVDSQMAVINRDFTASNTDTATVPAAFKSLIGNAGIRFALAHTAPDGSATPGYEYLATALQGFSLDGFRGSGEGFSDAKYRVSDGLPAWDPATYLNIWVINTLEKGSPSNILGLTLPPSLIDYYNLPEEEEGIVLNYKAWGSIFNFRGRTLTHELGHYFELRHTWGDDDGKCPNTGGEDDGIEDTPPQSNPTYGCPAFPKTDGCSNSAPGIMFMNYMDYTDDNCQRMFTKGQVSLMRSNLEIFGSSYDLTRHPEVLNYPGQIIKNEYVVYPNPSRGKINIGFTHTAEGLEYIRITDAYGRNISRIEAMPQRGFYTFELGNLSSGLYFMQLKFSDHTATEKIIITKE